MLAAAHSLQQALLYLLGWVKSCQAFVRGLLVLGYLWKLVGVVVGSCVRATLLNL